MAEPGGSTVAGRTLAARARPFVQLLWFAAWFVGSLWLVTPMAYHYWAAGGPPTPNPEWHKAWGNVFFSAVLGCWAIGGLGAWFMPPRPASSNRSSPRVMVSFPGLMVFLISGLAVYSVPGWGRLVLLAPVVLGGAVAAIYLWRSARSK